MGSIRVSRGGQRFFIIEWKMEGETFLNHYLLGNPPFSLEKYKRWVKPWVSTAEITS